MQRVCQTAGLPGILGNTGFAELGVMCKYLLFMYLRVAKHPRPRLAADLSILPLPPAARVGRHRRCQIGSSTGRGSVLPGAEPEWC